MAKSIPTSGIRDNHARGIVADFLKSHIKDGSHLSVVSAFFTIYAYETLKELLDHIDHMDFLFGELTPSESEIDKIADALRKAGLK